MSSWRLTSARALGTVLSYSARGSSLRNTLCSPLLLPLLFTDQREVIAADARRWSEVMGSVAFLALLRLPEFRSLYLFRLRCGKSAGYLLARVLTGIYRPEATLHFNVDAVGPGLFIQHGFATIIAAERIGANCWINQQVTIGFKDKVNRPVLEDDVVVHAGAKIIGGVTVGEGCTVGANAVVIRDVPPRHTAVGVPARYIPKRGGGGSRSHLRN